MGIQNARREELSKGLYSQSEILHTKLHVPFKLLGAGYEPLEISSWLNIVNWSSNFAVQTQVCATHLPSQFHLSLKNIIYLDTIVWHRCHSKAQLLVQLLIVCYYCNYAFLQVTSDREINFRADGSILPHTSSVSPAAIAGIPKCFYLFSPSNKLSCSTSLIYRPVPHIVTWARQFYKTQAFLKIPNCLLQPHHE